MFDTIESAIKDLCEGKIVIICDDEKRENEGDFVALAEKITPEMVNFMITNGKGLLCMPLDKGYAQKLGLNFMVENNTDNYRTAFLTSIDHVSNTTGISAFERSVTISKVLDNNSTINDFRKPGHIFPLLAKDKGILERPGHTEAVVDLAKLCNSKPAGVICEIVKENGEMARYNDLIKIAKQFDLKIISIKDLIDYRKTHDKLVAKEALANLPTKLGNFKMVGYSNILDEKEHVALIKGDLYRQTPLIRIHSECLTGDVFHSLRCDCGEQLDVAMQNIQKAKNGIIIYLRQEGRGIGLINKLKAYELQEQGLDTFDANLKLGFPSDLREYFWAAQILHDLKIKEVKLMTNNPNKIHELEKYGIKVIERVPLKVLANKENKTYLKTKIEKFAHLR